MSSTRDDDEARGTSRRSSEGDSDSNAIRQSGSSSYLEQIEDNTSPLPPALIEERHASAERTTLTAEERYSKLDASNYSSIDLPSEDINDNDNVVSPDHLMSIWSDRTYTGGDVAATNSLRHSTDNNDHDAAVARTVAEKIAAFNHSRPDELLQPGETITRWTNVSSQSQSSSLPPAKNPSWDRITSTTRANSLSNNARGEASYYAPNNPQYVEEDFHQPRFTATSPNNPHYEGDLQNNNDDEELPSLENLGYINNELGDAIATIHANNSILANSEDPYAVFSSMEENNDEEDRSYEDVLMDDDIAHSTNLEAGDIEQGIITPALVRCETEAYVVDDDIYDATPLEPTPPWYKHTRIKQCFGVVVMIVVALAIALGVTLSKDVLLHNTTTVTVLVGVSGAPSVSLAPSPLPTVCLNQIAASKQEIDLNILDMAGYFHDPSIQAQQQQDNVQSRKLINPKVAVDGNNMAVVVRQGIDDITNWSDPWTRRRAFSSNVNAPDDRVFITFYTLVSNNEWKRAQPPIRMAKEWGLGYDVSISGTTIFIGFPYSNDGAGSVLMYTKNLFGGWDRISEPFVTKDTTYVKFGMNVEVDGRLACVTDLNAAHLFRREEEGSSKHWVQFDTIPDVQECSIAGNNIALYDGDKSEIYKYDNSNTQMQGTVNPTTMATTTTTITTETTAVATTTTSTAASTTTKPASTAEAATTSTTEAAVATTEAPPVEDSSCANYDNKKQCRKDDTCVWDDDNGCSNNVSRRQTWVNSNNKWDKLDKLFNYNKRKVWDMDLSNEFLAQWEFDLLTKKSHAYIYKLDETDQTYTFHQRLLHPGPFYIQSIAINDELLVYSGIGQTHIYSLHNGIWEETTTLGEEYTDYQLSGRTLIATNGDNDVHSFNIRDCTRDTLTPSKSFSPTPSPSSQTPTLPPSMQPTSSMPPTTSQSPTLAPSSSIQPTETCYLIRISIEYDQFAAESSWTLTKGLDLIASHQAFNEDTPYTQTICLQEGVYTFKMTDTSGDGICCGKYGDGSYTVTRVSDGAVIVEGGEFEYSERTIFSLPV